VGSRLVDDEADLRVGVVALDAEEAHVVGRRRLDAQAAVGIADQTCGWARSLPGAIQRRRAVGAETGCRRTA
jgi:hypothetical protein